MQASSRNLHRQASIAAATLASTPVPSWAMAQAASAEPFGRA